MGRMSETDPAATDSAAVTPPQSPGERRLAHPPSDRYRAGEPSADDAATDPGASIARGLVLAIVAAILGAVALVLLGGIAAISAGLVIVAGAIGWMVGAALRFGAGDRIESRRRVVAAVLIALASVVIAQVGLWQYALTEGGVLPLADYLGEVFGPLVPLEAVAAATLAWLAAR